MNILTVKWMVFIITTTMIYETAQGITLKDINKMQLNKYTTDYMQQNISSYEHDNGTIFNKTESPYNNIDNWQSDYTEQITGIVLLIILIGGLVVGYNYVIIRKYVAERRLNQTISDTENRTDNIQRNFQSILKKIKETFKITQRSSPSSSRRYQRISETEEFQMIDIAAEERITFVHESNTESRQKKRSRQQSQPTTFVTHAIIERESISEDEFESHEN